MELQLHYYKTFYVYPTHYDTPQQTGFVNLYNSKCTATTRGKTSANMAEFASTRTRRQAAIVAAGAMHLVLLLSLLLAAPTAHSFAMSSQSRSSPSSSRTTMTTATTMKTTTTTTTTTSLHIFGGLKGAFSNDDSLGKAKDAGLSSGPRYNDQVSVNGKMIPKVVIDQKVSLVCNAARVKVPYNCQNGECGTCTVRMNGKPVRACVAKVPSGKCSIVTL